MLASAIRELVTSNSSPLLAAALFEKNVQIWDVVSQTRVSEFSTVFCAGARNLALAPGAELLVAGRSCSNGKIAAYKVPSGEKLWERKLPYPSSLCFQSSGEYVFCVCNNNYVMRLDIHTGITLEIMKGVSRYLEGPYGDLLTVSSRKRADPFRSIARGGTFDIPKLGFALLDAQFSPSSLCLTEAGGPVRCINCVDGRLEWMFNPGPNSHVLRLHYSQELNVFWGVLRDLTKKGFGSKHLMQFDAISGVYDQVCELDSWEEVFFSIENKLVTSSGEIKQLPSGALVGRFAFPQREYPND